MQCTLLAFQILFLAEIELSGMGEVLLDVLYKI